ncbi:MAG: trigger factor [Phycisphaerae bacterium]|nr:trigger factor [Phycisphaerae bacterium]
MTTATEATPNTVTVEETSPTTRRISVTIPADTVADRIELSFGTLRAESALPGFRKGKAPRALLEKRFGGTLLKETRSQLVADAYSKAIEEKQIRPVSDPEMSKESLEVELVRGKPFSFSVDVEVIPPFTMPDLEGIVVKKPVADITDEHVDAEILRQRYRWGTPNRIDGAFEHLDRMVGRAEVRVDGVDGIFFETDQALVVVPAKEDEGQGQVLGLIIDGLDKALLGMKVGDSISLTAVGPDHHEREEVRGKKLTINYAPANAERITPADVPALVEKFGLGEESILREQVRFALEQRRDSEQAAAQREQVFEWLLEKIDFPLPEKLSAAQMTRAIGRQRIELMHRGLDAETVEKRLAELRGSSEKQVRNRLRLFFVLAQIADQFDVKVTEAEVNGRIHEIAQSQGVRADQVRTQLTQSGGMNELALQIREHKTADRILQSAKVTDVPAEEWNKEVQSRAEEQARVAAGGTGSAETPKPEKKPSDKSK